MAVVLMIPGCLRAFTGGGFLTPLPSRAEIWIVPAVSGG